MCTSANDEADNDVETVSRGEAAHILTSKSVPDVTGRVPSAWLGWGAAHLERNIRG
jgi:hypothetical protein